MTLLARAHLRHLWRERWQALLALLGIAVGVAVIVAVDLVNASSREAMRIAGDELSGRATHLLTGPGERIDERRYAQLRRAWRAGAPGFEQVLAFTPVVTGHARLEAGTAVVPVRLLGIDPVTDSAVRALTADLQGDGTGVDGARLLLEGGAVALDGRSLARLGAAPGDRLALRTEAGTAQVHLVGVLPAPDALVGEGLLLADIATAQELLGRLGWIDRIDLVIERPPPAGTAARWLERWFPGLVVADAAPVVRELDAGLRIESLAERRADSRALASAFQLNLAALGLLAVVVGLFLIHGTLRYSVLRRQRQFGRLRALGVTPLELARMILMEALVLGVLGGVLGLLLGRLLAGALLGLVSATLQGLYDQVAIGALAFDAVPYAKGLLVGTVGAVAVALPVARRAAGSSPRTLQLAELATVAPLRRRLLTLLPCVLVGALALLPGTGYLGPLVAIGALLLIGAQLAPLGVGLILRALAAQARRAPLGVRMLLREATRGLGRSGVASAALVVAVATAVGMGVMVESFRGSVERWLEGRLAAPLYVRLPIGAEPLDAALGAAVLDLLDAGSRGRIERRSFDDRLQGRAVTVSLVEVRGEVPADLDLPLVAGAWDGVGALLSEPLARRLGLLRGSARLAPGARVQIDTGGGARTFAVGGVFREYGGGRGTLMLPAAAWPQAPPGVRTLELHGVDDVAALAAALRRQLPATADLRRNDEILALSLSIFDRTFRVTGVLQTLAGLVAAIGLFGALTALALERRGQYGVLRALGVDRQVPALQNLGESLLLAASAALLALPLGIAVAWVLVDVVNVRAFGWSLDLALPPGLFLQALAVALLAGALAAVAPALRLWRTPVVTMLADARALG
ncbi:MAG TPA: FtsX-like permease family protein [Pseudomonadales bacterium]|nr:FtsX-like permease family protein [Pseudomonadales bacterium]